MSTTTPTTPEAAKLADLPDAIERKHTHCPNNKNVTTSYKTAYAELATEYRKLTTPTSDVSWPPRLGNFVPCDADTAYELPISNGAKVLLLHSPQGWGIICFDPAEKKRTLGLSDEAAKAVAETIVRYYASKETHP